MMINVRSEEYTGVITGCDAYTILKEEESSLGYDISEALRRDRRDWLLDVGVVWSEMIAQKLKACGVPVGHTYTGIPKAVRFGWVLVKAATLHTVNLNAKVSGNLGLADVDDNAYARYFSGIRGLVYWYVVQRYKEIGVPTTPVWFGKDDVG